jgi:glycyl-tRNA synthetase
VSTEPVEPTSDAVSDVMDKVVNLCKRRGFVFPSAEIYGGFRSTYDYGPVGVLMLRNVKNAWWRSMVQMRTDVVGLDAAILSPPAVWEASGHLANFTDPMVDCRSCKARLRADHLDDPDTCPSCGATGTLTEARNFNLMFKTHAGPVEDAGAVAYLRPETAQGMFINFANVLNTSRKRPPFGIAQIGKSFRNEITPGNFVFRTREFEQMELEFFVPPDEAQRWYEYWCAERYEWYVQHGIDPSMLRMRPHDADELSHYSSATADVEFAFPWGWGELEGVANRGDFDLTQHAEHSGEKLEYFDQAANARYVPHVIEPAVGVDRIFLAVLCAAYAEEAVTDDKGKTETRTVLRLSPRIAPVKVAVLPLVKNKPELVAFAQALYKKLQRRYACFYDESGAVGRRYRRQDEIGTPWCVTIDFETLEQPGATFTLRERDSMQQRRVTETELLALLDEQVY